MAYTLNLQFGDRKYGKSTQLVECLHAGDTNYTAANGIDVSTADFRPVDSEGNPRPFSALRIGVGDGNIAVEYEGGGVATPSFYVAAEQGSIREFNGERIAAIYKTASGTTFSGKMWPIW